MTIQEITSKYGWEDMGVQKMKGMMSYSKKNMRMNIYSTGTITVQDSTARYDSGDIYKKIKDIPEWLTDNLPCL